MSQAKIPRDLHLQVAKEKHEQVAAIMKEEDIDCWIVFVRSTAAIPDPVMDLVVVGDIVWQSAFIFTLKDKKFKKTALVGNFDTINEENKGIWDEVIGYKEGITEPFRKIMGDINPKKIALNYSKDDVTADGLTYGLYMIISDILADYKEKFTSSEKIIAKLRGRKSKTEIELVTNACLMTKEIYAKMFTQLKAGQSETEVQQMFYDEMDRLEVESSWQRNSCPAVDAGPDKEIGHAGPKPDIYTQKGHTLHFDFGVKLQGYVSDIQRMVYFGKEEDIPEELIHGFDTVHEAITRAANFIKPGVKGYEVDKIARDHVLERGYKEYGHALGHQVGTKTHDGGTLLGPLWERYRDIPKGLVEENQIYTLELNVKTKNYGYVSLEEDIVITKDGCKFLMPRQEKWITIE